MWLESLLNQVVVDVRDQEVLPPRHPPSRRFLQMATFDVPSKEGQRDGGGWRG